MGVFLGVADQQFHVMIMGNGGGRILIDLTPPPPPPPTSSPTSSNPTLLEFGILALFKSNFTN